MISALAISLPAGTLFRGVLVGITYGLLAVGLVLVYRSSRILNFAHAEVGLCAAAVCEILVNRAKMPYWLAVVPSLAVAGGLGALCEIIVVRRLRRAPRVMTVVATLGLSKVLLLFTAVFRGTASSRMPLPPGFPQFHVGALFVNRAFSAILILGPLTVIALAGFLRRSRIGLVIRGAAANPDAARRAGISPNRASSIAWGLAGVFSGLSAILITAAQGSASAATTGPSLLVRAVAAAVIARFESLPVALGAGVALGMLQEAIAFNVTDSGRVELVMFIVILVGLLLRRGATSGRERESGSWLALSAWTTVPRAWRSSFAVRNAGWAVAALVGAIGAGVAILTTNSTAVTVAFVFVFAAIGLSVYVVTGMAGQLSLGQFAIAGVGSIVSTRVANGVGDLVPGLLAGGVAAATVSVLVGLPALRLRGLFATVTTLGFALLCREWMFQQSWMAGDGVSLDRARLAGITLGSSKAKSVGIIVVFGVLVLLVRNVAVGGLGRKVIAIRDNEDQARAFSVRALPMKVFAFAFAGFVAGVGGGLLALVTPSVSAATFPSIESITIVASAVIGGLGVLGGSLVGAFYLIGLPRLVPLDNFGLFATQIGWLLLLLYAPSGLAGLLAPLRESALRRLAGVGRSSKTDLATSASIVTGSLLDAVPASTASRRSDDGELLRVDAITKRYGGISAVGGVSMSVRRGETLGLIGTNGAGKTTLFEIIGGFTNPDTGTVLFDGVDITNAAPEKRARIGLVRSFQDAPLFPTLSVRETIRLALERVHPTPTLAAVIGARNEGRAVGKRADELLELTGLTGYADVPVSSLSTGTRRIAELACILAMEPTLLLLDEPSSGIAQRETEALAGVIESVKQRLGTTVIIIEHDMPLVRALSNRLIAMESGRIIAEGSPSAVLSDPQVVASYLGGDSTAIERSGAAIPAEHEHVASQTRPLRERRPIAGRAAARVARKRAVMTFNRRLAWVTLPMLVFSTLVAFLDDRISIPSWIVSYSGTLFTMMFLIHGFLSVYLFGVPRPSTNVRVVHIYIGYAVLVSTLAAQGAIGNEPIHSILLVPMWGFITAHVALAVRFALKRRLRRALDPELPLHSGAFLQPPVVSGARAATSGGAARARTRPTRAVTLVPVRFDPTMLALVGFAVVLVGFYTTRPDVTKTGAGLLPVAFLAIFAAHLIVGGQLLRLWRRCRHREVIVVALVMGGLLYDNTVLALGNLIGPGDTLRFLNAPRYWVHALFTPLVVLYAYMVARRCGLPWANGRARWWIAGTAVLVLFGVVTDGVRLRLRFEETAGVGRYVNEAVKGPPLAALATIAVVLFVAVRLWQRGYAGTMFGFALLMFVGAGAGATNPLVGNVGEVFFMLSLLAGLQATLGHRHVALRDRRPAWNGTQVPLRFNNAVVAVATGAAVLVLIHVAANIKVDHGPSAPVVVFFALAIAHGVLGWQLWKLYGLGRRWVLVTLPVVGALIYDNVALAFGNILGDSHSLLLLSRPRYWLHALLTPLLIPFALAVGRSCGLVWATTYRRTLLVLTGVLIAFGSWWDIVRQRLEYVDTAGVARYRNEALAGPPLPALVTIVVLLVVGWQIWKLGYRPMLGIFCALMFVSAGAGAANPLVANTGEVLFVCGLLAGVMAAMGHRREPVRADAPLRCAEPVLA